MQNKILIISIVAVVLSGLLYLVFTRDSYNGENTQNATQQQNQQRYIEEQQNEQYDEREMTVLDFILTYNYQTANLDAVDGSASSGTAYRLYREGEALYHVVTADMPDPAEGNVYEGWLVQKNPPKFFSTGVMYKITEGKWQLEYGNEMEYPTYLRVVITEETKVDATPERHIVEGDF